MKTYTVHEPPSAPADRLDRAETVVFVKDGFSWSAALFTPFWALANGLWLILVVYLVVVTLVSFSFNAAGANGNVLMAINIALHLLIGLEASSLHRWHLARKGWHYLGSVSGRSIQDCERRFFEAWLPDQPMIRSDALAGSSLAETFDLAASSNLARRWLPSLDRYRLRRS